MSSYDVKAVITSVPIYHVLKITKKQLEQDTEVHQKQL